MTLSIGVVVSCSGYQVIDTRNPFAKHDIKKLSIPMFVNKTPFSDINSFFTSAIYLQLDKYPDLILSAGEPDDQDAVLIGVITSEKSVDDVLKVVSRRFISGTGNLLSSIVGRKPFYLTSEYKGQLNLNLILIKNPLIKGKQLNKLPPKVVFSHRINLDFLILNNLKSNLNTDDGGVVNFTNNKGNFQLKMQEVAKNAAIKMERIIEY